MNVWQRKPWRSGHGPFWGSRWRHPINAIRNLRGWCIAAHDCQSPKVGCSCSGSYRFPGERKR